MKYESSLHLRIRSEGVEGFRREWRNIIFDKANEIIKY